MTPRLIPTTQLPSWYVRGRECSVFLIRAKQESMGMGMNQ